MKRVGLSRFSPLEVSRKVQQCLRFEGVNTNGVVTSDENFTSDSHVSTAVTNQISSDAIMSDGCCNNARSKNGILTAIKRKLNKAKRNKRYDTRSRSDSLSNKCQCHSENCCTSNHRTRKSKTSDKYVWPINTAVLRCQNHQVSEKDCDEATELLNSQSHSGETTSCTCFNPIPVQTDPDDHDVPPSSPTIKTGSTTSLLSVSRDAASSPVLDTDQNGSLFQPSHANSDEDAHIYATAVCDINENIQTENFEATSIIPRVANLTQELYKLSKYGWYWGPINQSEAESKLIDQSDGAFLVRDSSDDRYILSLSFRSCGHTLHTRIEHSNGLFSFYAQPEPEGRASIVELIEQSMWLSQSGVFCYSRSRSLGAPSFPVRLTKPVSRFNQVRSLQYLCRFVIRQYTRFDHIQKLPLPSQIKGYLEEGHY